MNLPALNALLNASAAVCLAGGFAAIRRRRIAVHRGFMLAAFACSALFLLSYLAHHAQAGHVRYGGQGAARALYFGILISHTVLAAAIVPLALRTLALAVQNRFDSHRRWAKWALPVWFYVSVTGVVIYRMLYG